MSFMADLLGLMWRHPLLLCVSLVLFTPPFYPVLRFFSPLLISTAVFLVVVVSFGPALERKAASRDGERHGNNVERGKPRQGGGNSRGFWEDHVKPQREREERSWLEGMVLSLKIRLHAWLEQKLRNDDVLSRLGNEGPVNLLTEDAEGEASRSRSTSSRKSSMKSTSDKDGSSSHRSRRGEVMEARSTDTDEYSESEDEEHHRSVSRSRRSSSGRPRSAEVMEARSVGKSEASDDGEGNRSASSRSSSRKRRSRKPGSRSNSGKGLKYDGDTEELRGGSSRPGEGAVAGVGGGRRERSRSKSRSNSLPKSSKSFRKYVEASDIDTDEDARLQEKALARHQKSMSRSRANSRSNSGKSYRHEDSQNFSNEEDARVQQEAVEVSFSRSKSGSRSSKRDKYDESKGLGWEEEEQLASRATSRSNSRKGIMLVPQVVVDTDSDDEPRLVQIARRPSSRTQSHSKSLKVSAVSRSGSDEGAAARVEVEARQADSRSGSRTSSRSNSGNGRDGALLTHSSETDGHSQIGEGHAKGEEVSAAAMRYSDGFLSSRSGSGRKVSLAVEEDSRGSQQNRSVKRSDSSSDSEAEVGKSRSDILRSSERSRERVLSGHAMPEEETTIPAALAKPAWQKHSEDEGTSSSSSEEEEEERPAPAKSSSKVLPGRLVRALSRELKAHIDEKLVVPSEQPEKKMERLQTLHHEISGILNNFSIHEEEEKLASVLGGLSAFVQGGDGKEVVPRTELLPKRWSSKTYADVDILPQTPSVKRLTDSAKDSQKLEMLKLYGNLLQAERENLTRQDSASSLA